MDEGAPDVQSFPLLTSKNISFIINATIGSTNNDEFPWPSTDAAILHQEDAVHSLLFYAILATQGTSSNILLVSALLVQPALCRRGNAFLAGQAFTNLVATAVLFPASAVTILSGASGTELDESSATFLCYAQSCGALWCFLTTSFNFLCIASENFLRTRKDDSDLYGACCRPASLTVFCILAWLAGGLGVACVLMSEKGPNPCRSRYENLDPLIFLAPVPPLGLAACAFLGALTTGRRRCEDGVREGREQSSQRHLLHSNCLSFVLFAVFWSPVVCLCAFGSLAAQKSSLWHLMSLGQTYTCVWPLIYALTHTAFRNAFMALVRYCCCKAHTDAIVVNGTRGPVSREKVSSGGSLRVHIGMEPRNNDGGRRARLSSLLVSDSSRRKIAEDFL